MLRRITKLAFVLIALLLTYLAVAAIWASVALPQLIDTKAIDARAIPLSKQHIDILLTVEDPSFYQHIGLDLSQGQGLTTISSSLASSVLILGKPLTGPAGGFQSFYRGVFQCCKKIDLGRDAMALVLNHKLSKQQQLKLYILNAYMGSHNGIQIKGLHKAARAYLGKPISQLTQDEFIILVSMLKAPNYFHPLKQTKKHRLRANRVKQLIDGNCQAKGWFDTLYTHCF